MASRSAPNETTDRGFGETPTTPSQDRAILVSRKEGLIEAHRRWLREDRAIDPEIAMEAGCYSGVVRFKKGTSANVFVTPCIVGDREVAWTARYEIGGRMKGFVSSEGAGQNLMFADLVWQEDPMLVMCEEMRLLKHEQPDRVVVLCEGQLDALACRMAGFVGISVPNGAKSTGWLEAWRPKLKLRRLVLWLDHDEDGKNLTTELLKVLPDEVAVAAPPEEVDGKPIKDANDLLRVGGIAAIKDAVLGARYTTVGSYDISPAKLLYAVHAFPTGLDFLDSRMLLCCGEHTAIVGRAGRGKTMFANYWAYAAARHNNEMVYFQSMEMIADGELTQDLAEFESGKPIADIVLDTNLYTTTLETLRKHVVALEPARAPPSKTPFDLCVDRIVRQARNGVRIHVVDNYAMVANDSKGKNENTQTKEDIIYLNKVARRFGLAIIVCYHARKAPAQYTIKNLPPELEDASGSAAIGNHCCLGVTLERVMEGDSDTNNTNMAVRKHRRAIHGHRCDFNIWFNFANMKFQMGGEGFIGIKRPGFEKKTNKGAQMSLIKGGKDKQEDAAF